MRPAGPSKIFQFCQFFPTAELSDNLEFSIVYTVHGIQYTVCRRKGLHGRRHNHCNYWVFRSCVKQLHFKAAAGAALDAEKSCEKAASAPRKSCVPLHAAAFIFAPKQLQNLTFLVKFLIIFLKNLILFVKF